MRRLARSHSQATRPLASIAPSLLFFPRATSTAQAAAQHNPETGSRHNQKSKENKSINLHHAHKSEPATKTPPHVTSQKTAQKPTSVRQTPTRRMTNLSVTNKVCQRIYYWGPLTNPTGAACAVHACAKADDSHPRGRVLA